MDGFQFWILILILFPAKTYKYRGVSEKSSAPFTKKMFFQECWKSCVGDNEAGDSHGRNIFTDSSKMEHFEEQLQWHRDRHAIYSPIDLSADFQAPVYPKKKSQREFIENALEKFAFIDLDPDEIRIFVDAMREQQAEPNEYIIRQGDEGDYFYILVEGKVNYVDQGLVIGQCVPGESFGELALLYESPRAVSCVAASKCFLWKLDRTTFRHVISKHAKQKGGEVVEILRSVEIFQALEETMLVRLADSMTPVKWKANERIVQKGSEGKIFYIIQEGKVKVHDIGLGDSPNADQILERGCYFGERSLMTGEKRAANVTAILDTVTLAIDRHVFEECLGPLKALLEFEMRKQAIKSVPIFANSDVSDPEYRQLAILLTERTFHDGEKLAESGKVDGDELWMIRSGRLLVVREDSGKIYHLDSGDFFGDRNILSANQVSRHTATVEDNLVAWQLTKSQIESVIGNITRLGGTSFFVQTKSSEIDFKELIKHRVLGEGAFGKVYLVSSVKSKDQPFALKQMVKSDILSSKQELSVVREKDFLSSLRHPFILSLKASYQDEDNLYLLLPLIPGGELFGVLQKQRLHKRGLRPRQSFFYLACVIEALGHFHQRNIAYRDLKLENILIDELGYPKIVDLGFTKVVRDKTYTLCGTPEYIAPEIIMSKGHDKSVDIWAYGVLVYELLCGQTPFYLRGSSQMNMFRRIVAVDYQIPAYLDPVDSGLISSILVRSPSRRLGNLLKGHLDLKEHQSFGLYDINFRDILQKTAVAPWKPPISNPLDSANFDEIGEKENRHHRGRHLTPEEQLLFKDF